MQAIMARLSSLYNCGSSWFSSRNSIILIMKTEGAGNELLFHGSVNHLICSNGFLYGTGIPTQMMEKILTLLVGLLIALGGWSLSRTFELSTGQAVLEDKVERLEMQLNLMDQKMDEMFDMDEEIMEQHEELFKKLQNSNPGYSYN